MSQLVNQEFILKRYGISRITLHKWRKNKNFPQPIPAGKKWRLDAIEAWEKAANE
ncbi:hypothetical protein tloyanaT_13460 [Thalassotalea loyana]|uniref:AlpA family phage regulatory protein n=1 Tax=Thalassotalea loyana TaxID=280483 RepID=A0ABQ6HAT7_9GAMM|nr:hypothetical protein [Thalassotalea loyana]GLX85094.1 hypothetical protein tloyanaT_13460 [Thalassotalea loyana]